MLKQISSALLILTFFASCENRYRKGMSSSQSSSAVDSKFVGKTNDDAYQVSVNEYDNNFASRYGLLYLKASNDPFTGRILTVDNGDSGEFVSSDESWKEGRKHGKSSKWFSNGIKMYERNYKEGRWHGSVTRWWPNGQKMYVRAYTNGVRHGNEATWRSDGTPLSLPADGTLSPVEPVIETVSDEETLPSIDLTDSPELPSFDPIAEDPGFDTLDTANDPEPIGLPEPSFDSPAETSDDGFSDLPTFPPMEEDNSALSTKEDLPSLPTAETTDSLPPISAPDLPADDSLPVLPGEDADDLPALPGLDEPSTESVTDPVPLPGLPEESDGGGLPPLPGMEDESGLAPLPGAEEEGFGDLPPLPPLP